MLQCCFVAAFSSTPEPSSNQLNRAAMDFVALKNRCSARQTENWRTGPLDCPLGPHLHCDALQGVAGCFPPNLNRLVGSLDQTGFNRLPDDSLLFWFNLDRHVARRLYSLTLRRQPSTTWCATKCWPDWYDFLRLERCGGAGFQGAQDWKMVLIGFSWF